MAMDEDPGHPLTRELLHWSDILSLRYRQLLEAITALDLDSCRRHLSIVRRLHSADQQFVEQHLIELVGESGESPDTEVKLFKADHLILSRTLALVETAISEIEDRQRRDPGSVRTALVERLDVLVRFDNILKRHQQRREELLIPAVESALDPNEGKRVADALRGVMQPLRLH